MSKNSPNTCGPSQPLILAVETSGRTGSVAVALGQQILAESAFSAPMRHSAEIFGAIEALLERFGRVPKEIKQIYISVGPGSFTGLRIAVTMAKTMNLANNVKIVAVDTLDVIAANAADYQKTHETQLDKIATILDAKRGQFFIAVYQNQKGNSRWEKIFPDSLMTAEQFLEKFAGRQASSGGKEQPIWLLGEGLVYHKDKFSTAGIRFLPENYWKATAAKVHLLGWDMAVQGRFADAVTLEPRYLRRPAPEEKLAAEHTEI